MNSFRRRQCSYLRKLKRLHWQCNKFSCLFVLNNFVSLFMLFLLRKPYFSSLTTIFRIHEIQMQNKRKRKLKTKTVKQILSWVSYKNQTPVINRNIYSQIVSTIESLKEKLLSFFFTFFNLSFILLKPKKKKNYV